jgi:sterol desaturase/sphingolipid hydroxylase (fatty acid hydroxylase superfamily)
MGSLQFLARTEWARARRPRADIDPRIPEERHRRSTLENSVVSVGLFFAAAFLLDGRFVLDVRHGVPLTLLEVVLVLGLYDFGYYLLHRFVFHGWLVGRRWHAVHHRVRTTYARDSLYIHPAETALGVLLMLGCVAAVGVGLGGVSVVGFGVAFGVYSIWNVVIHSGLRLDVREIRWITHMIGAHDAHHEAMKGGNYSSISPVFDVLFRTAVKPGYERS